MLKFIPNSKFQILNSKQITNPKSQFPKHLEKVWHLENWNLENCLGFRY
jgi:hypothetical protein